MTDSPASGLSNQSSPEIDFTSANFSSAWRDGQPPQAFELKDEAFKEPRMPAPPPEPTATHTSPGGSPGWGRTLFAMVMVGILTAVTWPGKENSNGQAPPAAEVRKVDGPPAILTGAATNLTSAEQATEFIKLGYFKPEVRELENNVSGLFTYEFEVKPEIAGQEKSMKLTGVTADSQDRRQLLRAISDAGMEVKSGPKEIQDGRSSTILDMLPSLFFTAVLIGGAYYVFRRLTKGDSSMSAEGEFMAGGKLKDRFSNIGGMEHVLDEMRELKAKIELVQKGEQGVNLQRGLLMTGPPGVGKTMLARALAGEIDAPFIKFDCSQLSTQLYVGTGTARVTNAFAQARALRDASTKELRKRPGATGKEEGVAILCLDEFESIGLRRTDGSDTSRGDAEHMKVVNTLLNEMDGFNQARNRNIIVFAATNNPEALDPALLRPGRFTKKIHIDLPHSPEQRMEILEALKNPVVNNRGFSIADQKSLEYIAKITPGKSGDHLRQILAEATDIAQLAGRKELTDADLFEAAQRADSGRLRRNYLTRERHELVAHHEHGHALASLACGVGVFLVSMMPRGESAGRVIPDPQGLAESMATMKDYLSRIYLGAGGRAAELQRYGKEGVTDGAISDLEQIRALTATMLTVGMLDGHYSMNLRRTPPSEWKEEHHAIVNKIAARAIEMNRRMIEIVGPEKMEELVRDSLDAGEELVGGKAQEFYASRLSPETIEKMRALAREFIKDPMGEGDARQAAA